ncbi:MAG: hypothetical protein J3K34DRAFT_442451 [Monoraphidium minutum]|nr:MAG: hypothetical protein J3K34DRAFT_442451 [Monoraphidium minutum]
MEAGGPGWLGGPPPPSRRRRKRLAGPPPQAARARVPYKRSSHAPAPSPLMLASPSILVAAAAAMVPLKSAPGGWRVANVVIKNFRAPRPGGRRGHKRTAKPSGRVAQSPAPCGLAGQGSRGAGRCLGGTCRGAFFAPLGVGREHAAVAKRGEGTPGMRGPARLRAPRFWGPRGSRLTIQRTSLLSPEIGARGANLAVRKWCRSSRWASWCVP